MIISFILYARDAEKSIPYRIFSRSVFRANLHPQLFEIILFLVFAKYLQNQITNIDAGGFSCYNIGKAPFITTTHRVIGADGSVGHFQLLIAQESSGTQRFFSRIGGWLQALEDGALLVVDEIEDSLHPLLTKRLIEMVQDNTINTEGAQLLFTTHDAMLLDFTFFRRDQIWFAEKDEKSCATELYSLASFSPRKGENIRKGYLQGRFGAIPFIGDDGLWSSSGYSSLEYRKTKRPSYRNG